MMQNEKVIENIVSSHAPAKGATAISHNFYRILLHELLNFSRFLRAKILKYVKFK